MVNPEAPLILQPEKNENIDIENHITPSSPTTKSLIDMQLPGRKVPCVVMVYKKDSAVFEHMGAKKHQVEKQGHSPWLCQK